MNIRLCDFFPLNQTSIYQTQTFFFTLGIFGRISSAIVPGAPCSIGLVYTKLKYIKTLCIWIHFMTRSINSLLFLIVYSDHFLFLYFILWRIV